MAKGQGKTGLVITIIVLAVTLVVVGTIVVLQNLNQQPAVTNQPSSTETDTTADQTTPTDETDASTGTDTTTDETDITVDPATLKSIDIEPMSIKVFYTKGIPGFEYAIQRASNGTHYVEFSSPDLVGTKCTDDEGIFATIIEDPSASEQQTTVNQTTTIGDMTYGLSLASDTCTAAPTLLAQYQDAFKSGFSSLSAL